MTAQFEREFPGFSAAWAADQLPTIPAGFEDQSWHNDTCPSWRHENLGLTLFIDWPNPCDREFPEGFTFTLCVDVQGLTNRVTAAQSDTWPVVLAEIERRLTRAYP